MKTTAFLKLVRTLVLGLVFVPFFAMANGQPTFSLIGVQKLDPTQAIVAVSFSENNAGYDFSNEPIVSVSYTNLVTGDTLASDTAAEYMPNTTNDFWLRNLTPETKYSFKAVMIYNGGRYETSTQTFTTPKQDAPSSDATVVNPVPTPTPGNTGGSDSASGSTLANIVKSISPDKLGSNLQNIVMTGGYGSSNGVSMSITDSHARVVSGDTVTYTIQYHNANQRTLHTARVMIQLPDQYVFNKGDGNTVSSTQDNMVTIYIGTIEPNESGQVTFDAKAIGPDNVPVTTKANLVYLGGSVSATDRDTYVGGSRSLLGASVFGAGFFPQTFVGWLIIIILLIVVIISARRYMKAPKPQVPPQK